MDVSLLPINLRTAFVKTDQKLPAPRCLLVVGLISPLHRGVGVGKGPSSAYLLCLGGQCPKTMNPSRLVHPRVCIQHARSHNWPSHAQSQAVPFLAQVAQGVIPKALPLDPKKGAH